MLDIGVIIQAPMQDKDWMKKCLLMGLLSFALMLIPIAGPFLSYFNAFGWMRTYADNRLRGDTTLPEPGMKYLAPGWRMFLMYLPIVGIMILGEALIFGTIAVGAAVKVPAISAIGGILGAVIFIPTMLWVTVMGPAIIFLHIVKNEQWASMQLKKQWQLMMAGGVDYLLFFVAILVAGIIGELGLVACGVGIIVSLPYCGAMYGAAVAEFNKVAADRIPS